MQTPNFFHRLLPVVLCLFSVSSLQAGEAWRDSLDAFLRTHCIDCHQGADAEGGLDLASFPSDLKEAETLRRWVLVHDRLQAGEMPPKDHPQPGRAEKSKAINVLSVALNTADRARSDVVLRRLNANEYENTIRDLFGVYVSVKELLPQDNPTAGFDNVGEGLAVSPEATAAYLRAADVALDAVFGPPKKPKYIKHETNLLDQKTFDGKPQ
ncbi:MAG: DUF1587 domain-containing protein, partial [Planctomycetaceae bacterium]|nr:DUF1587 domain-containing protein [Planctomycetaceae bacterium]